MQVRKISVGIDPGQLESDMQNLVSRAYDSGAINVEIVHPPGIIFSEDIIESVRINDSHASIHWPLNYPNDSIREAMDAYHNGIFLRIDSPPGMEDYGGGPINNSSHRNAYYHLCNLMTELESLSFYMGYHLSLAFATGNCRSVFCHDEENCIAMKRGFSCRHPFMGRPSLHAAGINSEEMAVSLNWELPPGRPLLAGLVMIV